MKKILCVSAIAILSCIGVAQAADATHFDGAYGAAEVGYDMSSYTTKSDRKDSVDSSGGLIGVAAGYQKNYGNKLIAGVEADITASGSSYKSDNVKLDKDVSYGLKLRPGYAINPTTAVFGTAGVNLTDYTTKGLTPSPVDKTMFGYTLGLGVETYVASNISLRMDYEHGWSDSFRAANVKIAPQTDKIAVGAAYHF